MNEEQFDMLIKYIDTSCKFCNTAIGHPDYDNRKGNKEDQLLLLKFLLVTK